MNRPCHILFRSLAIASAAFTLAACGQSETHTNEDIANAKMRVLATSSDPFAKELLATHSDYYYADIGYFFLKDQLVQLEKEQFNLGFQRAGGQLESTGRNRADWHEDAVELFADEKIYLASGDQATAECIVERILTEGTRADKLAAAQELARIAPRGRAAVQPKCSFLPE